MIIPRWVPSSPSCPPLSLEGGWSWSRGGLGEIGESLSWASLRKASWRRLLWVAPYLSRGLLSCWGLAHIDAGSHQPPFPVPYIPPPPVHPHERDNINQTNVFIVNPSPASFSRKGSIEGDDEGCARTARTFSTEQRTAPVPGAPPEGMRPLTLDQRGSGPPTHLGGPKEAGAAPAVAPPGGDGRSQPPPCGFPE